MKIAVTARGRGLESAVDPRFGRARGFVVVDTDAETTEFVDNGSAEQAASGAGVRAAQSVADAGAEVLLTGHCGPNAFHALRAAGVSVVVGVDGTVGDAVQRFVSGELRPTEAPDAGGGGRRAGGR
jgi:predicted Fe-Mo cluster-binding NifX family protein